MKTTVYEQYKTEKGEIVNDSHEMYTVDAREAVKNGKGRFSLQPFVKAEKPAKAKDSDKS
jgi:hypothetical protein